MEKLGQKNFAEVLGDAARDEHAPATETRLGDQGPGVRTGQKKSGLRELRRGWFTRHGAHAPAVHVDELQGPDHVETDASCPHAHNHLRRAFAGLEH